FVFLFFLPQNDEISKIKVEISGLEQKLNMAKVKTRNLKKLIEQEAKVSAQFAEALKQLPDKKEIPTLLTTITQLGKDSNLEFRLFSPQQEREQEFYMEIPVAMEVSGNYHNVGLFFDKVGRMNRIVNILNVSMRPEKPLSTNLITRCDAMTFRFETPSEPQKVAPKEAKK
ncbi:MAG: type 4a pilus biogenesis protein PilO, partial [Pseudomonadota bacterium]